jgi:hypothetical protein
VGGPDDFLAFFSFFDASGVCARLRALISACSFRVLRYITICPTPPPQGYGYLERQFPNLDYFETCRVVDEAESDEEL